MYATSDRTSGTGRRRGRRSWIAVVASFAIVAAACGSDDEPADGASADTSPPAETEAPEPADTEAPEPADTEAPEPEDTEPADTEAPEPEPADTEPADTEPADTEPAPDEGDGDSLTAIYPDLPPPTGEPMKVALVNTEGTPGLDFPDIRVNVGATFDYLNQHGGYGDRPLELINCTANGSPEGSQACAQEVVGEGAELVLLGLDLFPDYATYTAADVPVIGMLPILPGDYTANALFLTGGNATTMGSMASVAKDHFGAETVGIISADNAGANASEASLTASLDVAGIAHSTVKGGDNETDAGYQGLMRQAASENPDLLISLYADAGCIGTIRGRAALGIEIPVLTTSICAETSVIDEVGDDAIGWIFAGIQTDEITPERAILQEILAPALDVDPSEVDPNALGLGGLGLVMAMSLATYSNALVADGGELTGRSLWTYMETTPGLAQWPSGSLVECRQSDTYPSICSFTFPYAEYQPGGGVLTVPGLEAVSSIDYLP